ncbi:MAG TPA: hypothetical protein VHV83_21075 [Armatimonadota bacterium]|nr:hypothetical protein [Armatimonadota bacterium]
MCWWQVRLLASWWGGITWLLTQKYTDVGPVELIHLGEEFPTITGMTLAGQSLTIPDEFAGRVVLLMMADSYGARAQIEEWANYVTMRYADLPDLSYYQVALISGIGTIMRHAIDAAMVRGTPESVHSHVLTVYGDLRGVRRRLGMSGLPQAYLYVLGRTGRVAWRLKGQLDEESKIKLDEALVNQGIESKEG